MAAAAAAARRRGCLTFHARCEVEPRPSAIYPGAHLLILVPCVQLELQLPLQKGKSKRVRTAA